jgi:hypothetical protein
MKALFVISSLTVIGAFCAFCVIKPRKVVSYLRADYIKSSIKWPTMKIVFMEWFPIYVRGMGVMGLMVVLVALVDFLQQNSK